jgi:hypothetical protein
VGSLGNTICATSWLKALAGKIPRGYNGSKAQVREGIDRSCNSFCLFIVSQKKVCFMKLFLFLTILISLSASSCKKTKDAHLPKSKIDYIPIITANSPTQVIQGQLIQSRVKCGFYDHSADIIFLNFEIKETLPRQYSIRAIAFYDNINYYIS